MAAFGKHPGWNDHIDDLGLDTQRLIEFKRKLYVDGVGACVEGGRWDRLEPGQALPGYAHVFMYRSGGDLVIGRMWSSQDGKGRSRYPMVLCVHIRGAGVDEALPMVLPALERAQIKCEAAGTAPEVVRIVGDLTESLRVQAAALEPRRGDSREAPGGLRDLADQPSLGPARRGYHRVMYQIEHELAPFLRGQGTSRSSRAPEVSTRQIRLPACWTDPQTVLSRWSAMLAARVDAYFPAMFVLPLGREWLDVIVGEMSGPELFCLRASSKLVPPVSEIPYTIEPDQAFRYDQLALTPSGVAEPRGTNGASGAGSVWSKPVSDPAREGSRSNRTMLVLALLLAALLAGALLWLVLDARRHARRSGGPAASLHVERRLVAPLGGALRLITTAIGASLRPATIAGLPAWSASGESDRVQPDHAAATDQLVTDSPAINELWHEQRERMGAFYAPSDAADLAAHAQRLKTALTDLDRQTPATIHVGSAGGWQAELGRELARRREARFGEAFQAWRGQLIDPADETARQVFERLRSAGIQDAESFTKLAADLTLVEGALNEVVGIDVPLAGGAGAGAIISRWEAIGLLRDRGVRDAVAPVLSRVTALREIANEMDTDRLLARTAESAKPEPEIVVGVWRRLARRVGVTWPASGDDVAAEARLGRDIRAIADGMRDRSRADALREELATEQRRRLVRMLAIADRADQYEAAARAIDVLGMKAEDFDARTRFNLLLHEFKKKLGEGGESPGPDDQTTRRLAQEFVQQARSLPGGLPFLANAAATIATIEGLLAGEGRTPTAVDGTGLGPAATGKYFGRRDGDRLIFRPIGSDVGAVALEFVRIDPPAGGPPFFLGTTEVSVEMFVSLAKADGSREAIQRLVPVFEAASDPRVGPRAWEWDAAKTTLMPARRWLTFGLGNARDQYAPGESVTAPEPDSPMQWITPRAAACAAAMVGCRLPSREEWNAAFARYGSALKPGECNLRDQTWARHQQFVDKQLAAGRNVQSADAGSFEPSGGETGATDDGLLWFAPVRAGGGSPVHHLWGNVAEYLMDAAGEVSPTNAKSAAAAEFMTRHADDLFIAGASALSDSASAAAAPRETTLADAVEGFSDVGFRLAFGGAGTRAGETSLAASMRDALTPTPYLTPR